MRPSELSPTDNCHQIAINKFIELDEKAVQPLLSILGAMFPGHFSPESAVWSYRVNDDSTYENDGNTKAPGVRHHGLCTIPVCRSAHDFEFLDWYNGNGVSAINVHSDVHLRLSDHMVKLESCELSISPFLTDVESRNNSRRVSLCMNSSCVKFHEHWNHLLRLCLLVQEIIDSKAISDRLSKVLLKSWSNAGDWWCSLSNNEQNALARKHFPILRSFHFLPDSSWVNDMWRMEINEVEVKDGTTKLTEVLPS